MGMHWGLIIVFAVLHSTHATLIQVVSCGDWDACPVNRSTTTGLGAEIRFGNVTVVDYHNVQRGMNYVMFVDQTTVWKTGVLTTGDVDGAITFDSGPPSNNYSEFLDSIPDNTVIAIAIAGDGARFNAELVRTALASFGALLSPAVAPNSISNYTSDPHYGNSWAFIGCKHCNNGVYAEKTALRNSNGSQVSLDVLPYAPGRYGPWGKCSLPCGGGFQLRQCIPSPLNLTTNCTSQGPAIQPCNTIECLAWGNWSAWSGCDGCSSSQSRTCTVGPPPQNLPCIGNFHQSCTAICSSDGQWTEWSDCTQQCGGGFQYRECQGQSGSGRKCYAFGGYGETRMCNTQPCCGRTLMSGMGLSNPKIKAQYTFTCPNHCPSNVDGVTVTTPWPPGAGLPQGMWHGVAHDEDYYTIDSEICSSAFHATGVAGGTYKVNVKAEFLEAESKRIQRYDAGERYNIPSLSWPSPYPVVFQFQSVRQPEFVLNGLTYQPKSKSLNGGEILLQRQSRLAQDESATIELTPEVLQAIRTIQETKTSERVGSKH